MIKTVFILASGGTYGAYDYGVLKFLYEQDPNLHPALVTGVSMGALQAAILAGGKNHPIDTLGYFWDQLSQLPSWMETSPMGLLNYPHFYRYRPDWFMATMGTAMYDMTPLRALVEDCIDFEKLNTSPVHLLLPAAKVGTGELVYFDNQAQAITLDHLMANASLPPLFPMTWVEGEPYWDGGYFDHQLLEAVLARLPGGKTHLILTSLLATEAPLPENPSEVYLRMIQMMVNCKITAMAGTARQWSTLPGHHFTHIANTTPELTGYGISREKIQRRTRSGYEDARKISGKLRPGRV